MHISNKRLNVVSFESLYLGLCELTVRKSSKDFGNQLHIIYRTIVLVCVSHAGF
jgi:hypothetical protein